MRMKFKHLHVNERFPVVVVNAIQAGFKRAKSIQIHETRNRTTIILSAVKLPLVKVSK